MKRYDVAILGAGIVGLSASYFSIEAGLKTILIDSKIPGRGSSIKSTGIITRQLYTKREIELASETIGILIDIIPNIEEITYSREFISIENENDAFQDFRFYRKHMDDVKVYYSSEALDKWDSIKLEEGEAVVYTSKDLMIDSIGLINILHKIISGNDILLDKLYKKADYIEDSGEELIVHLEDGDKIYVDNIILAMGSWNRGFLSLQRIYIPVHTYACISMSIETPIDVLISGSDEVNYLYWQRKSNSIVLAGEYYQSTPIATPEDIKMINIEAKKESLKRSLRKRFKNMDEIRFREILIGTCSFTTGKRPILKKVLRNTYLIDGLGGYGLTWGPALAKRTIKNIITNK